MAAIAGIFGTAVVLLGAALGSFAGVCIERWPLGQSMRRPRSRCAACATPIAWYDNLPLLSFLVLRGRCRHCGVAIAPRLVLLEVLGAALFAAVWSRFGSSIELVVWLPMTWLLLVVTFLDIDHFWVPDALTYPGMLGAAAAACLPGRLGLRAALLGLLPAVLLGSTAWLFGRLLRKEAMGLGDIKLLALIGLCTGLPLGLGILLLAALQGALVGSAVLCLGGHAARADAAEILPEAADPEEAAWEPPPGALPFGPFLSLATWQVVLLPELLPAAQRLGFGLIYRMVAS